MSISDYKYSPKETSEKDLTLYLGDFLRGFVKFWWIGVALSIVLSIGMSYVSYTGFKPKYEVSATFTVHTENTTLANDAYAYYYNRSTANQLATVFPHALESKLLKDRVCKALGVEVMLATVSASCVEGTNLITLTTQGVDPQATYDTLLAVIDNYSYITEYIIGPTRLVTLSQPQVPTEPINESTWYLYGLMGLAIGLAVGAVWIALYAVMRRTIRTKEDIQQELNRTCVGVLPQVTFKRYAHKGNEEILLTNPLLGKEYTEAYRLLRDSVQNCMQQEDKIVLLSSTAQGEGKSVTTLNLAAMLGKSHDRVLVIDGDIRNSGISKILGRVGKKPEETRTVSSELYRIDHVEELSFDVLTFDAKTEDLWRIMRVSELKKIIDPLRAEYDVILIDTPPCGIISDAAIFAGVADVAFYIIRQDAVLTSRIREGINLLLSTDVRFAGCILNGVVNGMGGYSSNYSYGGYRAYYGYGYTGKYGGKYKAEKRLRRR